MARMIILDKIKKLFEKNPHSRNVEMSTQKTSIKGYPTYAQVQSGEIAYEAAVIDIANDISWILDTAYKAAYPDAYITGILKEFVSPVKELNNASAFLVMVGGVCVSFQEAAGQEISLYNFVLEAENIAGHPLLTDAAWREPFYRFAADLAREGCLARRTFETEEEYDSLFHYIGECIRMYAVKHPVDANGVPLEYIQEKGDPNGIAAAVVDAGRVSSEVRDGGTDNETKLTESVNSSRESHRHTYDNETHEEVINEIIDESDPAECVLDIPEDPFF